MAKTKKSEQDKKDKKARAVVLLSFADAYEIPDENDLKREDRDKRGRPTVMTKQVLSKLEAAFKIGANKREACTFAGIGEATFYRFLEAYPDFESEIEDWQNDPVLAARSNIIAAIKDSKSLPESWGYLRAKRKKEFAEEKNLNVGAGVVTAAELEEIAERGVVPDMTLVEDKKGNK